MKNDEVFDYNETKNFLHVGKYDIIHDPYKTVAAFLGVDDKIIKKFVKSQEVEGLGYLPTFEYAKLKPKVRFLNKPKGILETCVERRPVYGLVENATRDNWYYGTKKAAIHAGLIHILINFEPEGTDHWVDDLPMLHGKSESLLLFNFNKKFCTTIAIGTVFSSGNKIYFRQFLEKNCEVMDKIQIKDNTTTN